MPIAFLSPRTSNSLCQKVLASVWSWKTFPLHCSSWTGCSFRWKQGKKHSLSSMPLQDMIQRHPLQDFLHSYCGKSSKIFNKNAGISFAFWRQTYRENCKLNSPRKNAAVTNLDRTVLLNDVIRKILLVFVDNCTSAGHRHSATNQDNASEDTVRTNTQ